MTDIYDSKRELVKIGPCKWAPNLDVAVWLSQNDDTILKVLAHISDFVINICHLWHQSLKYVSAVVEEYRLNHS